ncbi:hypothetical protein BGC07_00175 [Piscirickettsia litoralis]|uniref:Uncharacterized protein n=1 Tax=Piscirickettsia litoralis TaxID=1891921 RepID=A0ABX2ZZN1_9GAMM|nr:hypothetical protein BGC07_00175 [Piscirickettsia litoralis]
MDKDEEFWLVCTVYTVLTVYIVILIFKGLSMVFSIITAMTAILSIIITLHTRITHNRDAKREINIRFHEQRFSIYKRLKKFSTRN